MLMGAAIDGRKNGSYAPLVVRGGNLRGIEYRLPVASAQVKSAVLLAGLNLDGVTKVIEPEASRDHTERMLKAMGAKLKIEGKVISLIGGKELEPQEFTVPGDISSAAFFMVGASLVPGSEVVLREVGINPSRAGVIEVLRRMGASIRVENERLVSGEPVADLVIKHALLKGVNIEDELIPSLIDELPVLAVAMALAEGESSVEGAQELRVKETDRIKAVCTNLSALGVEIEETSDGFRVRGSKVLKGGETDSFGDHRLAMAMGIAGLIAREGIHLKRSEAVSVSYPSFWEDLERIREN
jgi:3-phosphoshikimate 1-carboxyvinyltransferase